MRQWFDRRENFGHPYETDIVLLNTFPVRNDNHSAAVLSD